jgi:hypothetical protein
MRVREERDLADRKLAKSGWSDRRVAHLVLGGDARRGAYALSEGGWLDWGGWRDEMLDVHPLGDMIHPKSGDGGRVLRALSPFDICGGLLA